MQTIIVFSSVRWNFLFQRHQSIATHLGSHHKVYFVEPSVRSIHQLLAFVKNPKKIRAKSTIQDSFVPTNILIVKRRIFNIFGTFDGNIIRKVKNSSNIRAVIVYIPSKRTCKLIQKNTDVRFIYDRVLDWSKVEKAWYAPKDSETNEDFIFKAKNCEVISDSGHFIDTLNLNSRVNAKFIPTIPLSGYWELQGMPNGPLGYYGNLRESEIDIQLVEELAKEHDVHVVGIFTREIEERLSSSGVFFTQAVSVDKLPKLISTWSKIILPYKILPRTSTFVPDKIWSAASTRLQVVASGIEVPRYFQGRICLATDREDFIRQCAMEFRPQKATYMDSEKLEKLILNSNERI